MKPMKIAAVVAGSVLALGAAAPAFAADAPLTPASLNGALDAVASHGLRDGSPLKTNALDTENEGSVVNAVKKTTDGLNKKTAGKGKAKGKGKGAGKGAGAIADAGKLLGGLSLGK
ncbi:hypothetical protein ACFRR7_21520 [Streptomyces sp. NPDC056909]|uniref:hypothetical protein n=1 Tax=unclassified Streptomyces TaxID=2593676 RepID=UPI0036A1B4D7